MVNAGIPIKANNEPIAGILAIKKYIKIIIAATKGIMNNIISERIILKNEKIENIIASKTFIEDLVFANSIKILPAAVYPIKKITEAIIIPIPKTKIDNAPDLYSITVASLIVPAKMAAEMIIVISKRIIAFICLKASKDLIRIANLNTDSFSVLSIYPPKE